MLELGVRYVDCSIGAIGGQPATGAAKYSAGFTGNTCSEDLIAVLEEMGVRTGVDLHALIDAGRRAEDILGQRLRSNVVRSGPVIHGESSPDKEPGVKPTGVTTSPGLQTAACIAMPRMTVRLRRASVQLPAGRQTRSSAIGRRDLDRDRRQRADVTRRRAAGGGAAPPGRPSRPCSPGWQTRPRAPAARARPTR